MTYVSEISTLYTLNLYRAVCQLYVNNAGTKKKSWNSELFSLLPSFTRFPLCFLPFPAFSLNASLDLAAQLATHISTRKPVP